MKEILETMPRIELALIIIGTAALMLGIIFVYAMIHEYRMYPVSYTHLTLPTSDLV